jgi:hypothetical protein
MGRRRPVGLDLNSPGADVDWDIRTGVVSFRGAGSGCRFRFERPKAAAELDLTVT